MIHTCGTSMTNFIFVHALPKENVDWLPRCVNGGFLLADAVSEWGRGGDMVIRFCILILCHKVCVALYYYNQ